MEGRTGVKTTVNRTRNLQRTEKMVPAAAWVVMVSMMKEVAN